MKEGFIKPSFLIKKYIDDILLVLQIIFKTVKLKRWLDIIAPIAILNINFKNNLQKVF